MNSTGAYYYYDTDSTDSGSHFTWTGDNIVLPQGTTITYPFAPFKEFLHICPNCRNVIEGEGYEHNLKGSKWLRFCDEECCKEWGEKGIKEAMLL